MIEKQVVKRQKKDIVIERMMKDLRQTCSHFFKRFEKCAVEKSCNAGAEEIVVEKNYLISSLGCGEMTFATCDATCDANCSV